MTDVRRAQRRALVGLVTTGLLLALVVNADGLPLLGRGGTDYRAEFTDASGLAPGDPVKVSGITVGSVDHIEISGDHVLVEIEVDADVALGDRTRASVGSGSLLGDKYVKLVSAGAEGLAAGATIPLARTEPAYDVVDAFGDLADTTAQLDDRAIASALSTLADTFRGARPEVQAAVSGMTRLSEAVARRDRDLEVLLDHASEVTAVLAERRDDVGELLRSSDLLLGELQRRRSAVRELLVTTRELSDSLHAVVRDNQRRLTPALRDLHKVTRVLARRQSELGATIRNMEIYGRYYTNVVGNGPWFDNYIPRIPDSVRIEVGR